MALSERSQSDGPSMPMDPHIPFPRSPIHLATVAVFAAALVATLVAAQGALSGFLSEWDAIEGRRLSVEQGTELAHAALMGRAVNALAARYATDIPAGDPDLTWDGLASLTQGPAADCLKESGFQASLSRRWTTDDRCAAKPSFVVTRSDGQGTEVMVGPLSGYAMRPVLDAASPDPSIAFGYRVTTGTVAPDGSRAWDDPRSRGGDWKPDMPAGARGYLWIKMGSAAR